MDPSETVDSSTVCGVLWFLLSDPTKQHWPVLVIGMESSFASVGPFTRAFKATMGFTPHEFRHHTKKGSELISMKMSSDPFLTL
jgi:AraC-like DNA-binding protein